MARTRLRATTPRIDRAIRIGSSTQRAAASTVTGVERHLHRAGAPAARFLQPERHDAEAAEAGFVAEQHQHADADLQTAHHGGIDRVDRADRDHARQQRRLHGEDRHRQEGPDGEGASERHPGEGVEGQIGDEEHRRERQPGRVVDQESDAGGAPPVARPASLNM